MGPGSGDAAEAGGALAEAVDAADLDARVRVLSADHLTVADVDADVVDGATEEHQVTGTQVAARDALGGVELHAGVVGQRLADLAVDVLHETRAVERVGTGGGPDVGLALLRDREVDDGRSGRGRGGGSGGSRSRGHRGDGLDGRGAGRELDVLADVDPVGVGDDALVQRHDRLDVAQLGQPVT